MSDPDGPGDDSGLRALLQSAGAEWLELPVLHPADPFLETAGEEIRRRMFVTEGPTGERLALRPDFTIPVCLHHLATARGPRRYAYRGLVFRRHDAGSPERLEAGFEDIGRPATPAADAEAVALALEAATRVGSTPPTLDLGDHGVFAALLAALGLPGRWRRRLRRSLGAPRVMAAHLDRLAAGGERGEAVAEPAIRRAVAAGDRAILVTLIEERAAAWGISGGGRTAAEIADRTLDGRALPDPALAARSVAALRDYLALRTPLRTAADALAAFAKDHDADLGAAVDGFADRISALLTTMGPAPATFRGGFGRPLDYYTGIVFELRTGDDAPVAGGGRYDRLLEMLGAPGPVPAIGFAIRLDRGEAQG